MISEHGYWIGEEAKSQHIHDLSLSRGLQMFFQQEGATSIVDLGCGMGNYVREFRAAGLRADGFDGNPNTPTLTGGICGVADLTQPLSFPQPYDWVMSLEVGEHVPARFETAVIENMHRNNVRGIVLSWAVEGQSGHGHVNCRNNDYIKARMAELGYTNDVAAESRLRQISSLSWFKNTIMVFRRG